MITRIEAYRYRCFAQLAINLGEYNVLAGPNGAGKTTLLDIPTLLGDLLNQRRDIGEAFLQTQPTWPQAPRAHLLRDLIHKQRGNDFVRAIEATLPDEIAEVLYETSSAGAKKDRDDAQIAFDMNCGSKTSITPFTFPTNTCTYFLQVDALPWAQPGDCRASRKES